jgi:hypothetical protein
MSASQSSDCRYDERLDTSGVVDERTLAAVVDTVAPGVSLSRDGDGDGTRAPTLTMLTSVDGFGGRESTAAAALRASASEHMDMSAQKTARTELKLSARRRLGGSSARAGEPGAHGPFLDGARDGEPPEPPAASEEEGWPPRRPHQGAHLAHAQGHGAGAREEDGGGRELHAGPSPSLL